MKNLFFSFTIILIAISAFSCGDAQQNDDKKDTFTYENLIWDERGEYYTVPVGLCEDYPEETTNAEIWRADFELLKKFDVKFLRISFGWDSMEPEPGKYDWLFWDEFVNMAVDEYGITLIPYICYTPYWNSTTDDSLKSWRYEPENFEAFGGFVEALVTRYKDKIKTWEIWNEPDITWFWSGTAESYSRLLKIGSNAVRKADPEALVVFGGLAHKVEFMEECFKEHNASEYVDIVNIHNYFETWSPSPLEDIDDYVYDIADIVETYGNGQPIWMAEVGYGTWRAGPALVSEGYTAYYKYEHTPEYQAIDLFKRLSLVAATGKISAIAWYEIKDLPPVEDVIGDANNRHLGISYVDHSPKPAAYALQFFNDLFRDKYKSIDKDVVITSDVEESDAVVRTFRKKDGSVIVVAWLQTTIYEDRTDDDSGAVIDEREEMMTIEIPGEYSEAVLYNELGDVLEYTGFKIDEDKALVTDLKLNGGMVAVLEIK